MFDCLLFAVFYDNISFIVSQTLLKQVITNHPWMCRRQKRIVHLVKHAPWRDVYVQHVWPPLPIVRSPIHSMTQHRTASCTIKQYSVKNSSHQHTHVSRWVHVLVAVVVEPVDKEEVTCVLLGEEEESGSGGGDLAQTLDLWKHSCSNGRRCVRRGVVVWWCTASKHSFSTDRRHPSGAGHVQCNPPWSPPPYPPFPPFYGRLIKRRWRQRLSNETTRWRPDHQGG